jgi:hypothetical protein
MKFLEKHWWVIVAILVLWWYAVTNRSTTFSDVTGNPADATDSSAGDSLFNFGGGDGTGSPNASDSTNMWLQALGVAALLLVAL